MGDAKRRGDLATRIQQAQAVAERAKKDRLERERIEQEAVTPVEREQRKQARHKLSLLTAAALGATAL